MDFFPENKGVKVKTIQLRIHVSINVEDKIKNTKITDEMLQRVKMC